MKKIILSLVITSVLIIGGLSFYSMKTNFKNTQSQVLSNTQANKSSNPTIFNLAKIKKILNVSDIQADPSSYKGIITINGVMAGVAKDDPKAFAIVDTSEVKACQRISCGTYYLMIKYNGKLPQLGDEINITGSFTGSGNNLIFNATEFKSLGSIIPKGGQ